MEQPAVDEQALRRTVTAHLEVDVAEPALLALQVAVAGPAPDERLAVTRDGEPVPVREIDGGHGGRGRQAGLGRRPRRAATPRTPRSSPPTAGP